MRKEPKQDERASLVGSTGRQKPRVLLPEFSLLLTEQTREPRPAGRCPDTSGLTSRAHLSLAGRKFSPVTHAVFKTKLEKPITMGFGPQKG